MSAHQHRISLAPAAAKSRMGTVTSGDTGSVPRSVPGSVPGTVPGTSEACTPAIGQVAALVGDVVSHLETSSDGAPLHLMVAACNAALEGCLEAQRDGRDREEREPNARDDLARLARLLTVVDRTDAAFVMRQIRRVLGRFDVCGA